MRIIVWIFLLIGISACSNNTNYSKSSEQTVAAAIPVNKVEHSLFLEENIDLIGKRIQNFFRLTDSTSLVVSEEKLFVYSDQGYQLYQIGEKGEGPKQYIRIDKVSVSDKYVYIWNNVQKKILVYAFSGEFIKSYNLPQLGIADFVIYKDHLLCCLFNGTEGDKSIEIYDLHTMDTILSLTSKTEEDQLLFLAEQAGGVCLNGTKLYWSYPSKLALYVLDLENLETPVNEIVYKDDEFMVRKLGEKAYSLINANKFKAMEFINSNSRIVQVDTYDNFIFVMAETGNIIWQANGNFSYENRKIKLYMIDSRNWASLSTYVYDIPSYCGLTKFVDGYLYRFRASFSKDDYKVLMDKVSAHL